MDARKILIVDDDQVTAEVIRMLLHHEGYSLFVVHDAQAAFDLIAQTQDFDLILLDVVLPDLSGTEVCKRIKAEPRMAHVPIILMSGAFTNESGVRAGLDAGADGYLEKPIEDIALRAWVKATLRISTLQRELAEQMAGDRSSYKETLEEFAKLSHSVNNPLQALYATVDILSLSIPATEELESLTSDILGHAEKVAQIVTRASLRAKAVLHAPSTSHAPRPGH